MRKVQDTAARERRWFALALSMSFALILWFVGAVVFMITERKQEWTYFDALYFTYVCLLTIGYGSELLICRVPKRVLIRRQIWLRNRTRARHSSSSGRFSPSHP